MTKILSSPNRACLAVFIFALVFISGSAFFHSVNKWFTLDEALEASRAHMINEAGLAGPAQALGTEGLTHPPLYEASLALFFKLFGENEAAGRSFGILCYAAVGVILGFLFWHLTRGEEMFLRGAGLLVCLALYLINPLLIQHSMLIDADSTTTYFFTALYAWIFIRYGESRGRTYVLSRLALATVFATAFFGKEGTPFLLVSGTILYRLLNRQWKELFFEAALIGLSGAALIAMGIFFFQLFSGETMMFFFKQQHSFRVGRAMELALSGRILKNLHYIVRWPVFWMSAPFWGWLLFILVKRAASFFQTRRLELLDYCFLTGMLIWTPYLFFKPSIDMMKYQYPAYPLLLAGMITESVRVFRPHHDAITRFFKTNKTVLPAALAVAAMLTVYYYGLGDYILQLYQQSKAPAWKQLIAAYAWPLLIVFFVWVFWALRRRSLAAGTFVAACFLCTVPVNAALDLRQLAPYTTVESWLNYGEKGFVETTDYLAKNLTAGQSVSVRDDIYYYLKYRHRTPMRKFYSLREFFLAPDVGAIQRLIDDELEYIVLDTVSLTYIPVKNRAGVMLLTRYKMDRTFGNFRVFKKKKIKK